MRKSILALLSLVLAPLAAHGHDTPAAGGCAMPGVWLTPAAAGTLPADLPSLMDRLAQQQVALLGERHDSLEDHRWQLQTLAQLHARRPEMAIGFEMFPRRLQPVLDRWVAGDLSEEEFLRQADWFRVWSFDSRGYMPLFHFARMNRIPMLALNVERSLVEQVGKQGWDGTGEAAKEGVSRPALPDSRYLDELRAVFDQHPTRESGNADFSRFVEAQTVWDRAMAEAIASHLRQRPNALVVGIMGSGHVRNGHGVAHQLADLGVSRTAKLLTWDVADSCTGITPRLADAVFVVRPGTVPPPRLGIAMEEDPKGVRISKVVEESVAARAGIQVGDVVTEIAGRAARGPEDVRAAVQRQAPGTWLPLRLHRGGSEIEVVARFPADS